MLGHAQPPTYFSCASNATGALKLFRQDLPSWYSQDFGPASRTRHIETCNFSSTCADLSAELETDRTTDGVPGAALSRTTSRYLLRIGTHMLLPDLQDEFDKALASRYGGVRGRPRGCARACRACGAPGPRHFVCNVHTGTVSRMLTSARVSQQTLCIILFTLELVALGL